MKPIIKVENLSKRYKLGAPAAGYSTLRESLARSPLKILSRRAEKTDETFWALKDVNFEINPGEVVGIIGRNGAGKSTLLKILARVTEPTAGRVELYGVTSSLLEVGTGFHPELTGRENIFVNGAILGMRQQEIVKRFDEIVEFAEIAQFLDTPVKRYSSGMYMKLAFSVAAHLNPDILIIDEVLSVGDAQFQKKCLGKVKDVAKAGRTVLFVSHNMAAVENLCERGIVLEKGAVNFAGEQSRAIAYYLENVNRDFDRNLKARTDRSGSGEIRLTRIEIRDFDGNQLNNIISGQDIEFCFDYEKSPDFRKSNVVVGLLVRTFLDVPVFLQHNVLTGDDLGKLPETGTFICRIRKIPLPAASYLLSLSVMCAGEYLDRIDDADELNVTEGDFFGSGEVAPISHGCCLVDAEWRRE